MFFLVGHGPFDFRDVLFCNIELWKQLLPIFVSSLGNFEGFFFDVKSFSPLQGHWKPLQKVQGKNGQPVNPFAVQGQTGQPTNPFAVQGQTGQPMNPFAAFQSGQVRMVAGFYFEIILPASLAARP